MMYWFCDWIANWWLEDKLLISQLWIIIFYPVQYGEKIMIVEAITIEKTLKYNFVIIEKI